MSQNGGELMSWSPLASAALGYGYSFLILIFYKWQVAGEVSKQPNKQ